MDQFLDSDGKAEPPFCEVGGYVTSLSRSDTLNCRVEFADEGFENLADRVVEYRLCEGLWVHEEAESEFIITTVLAVLGSE